jgi:hypothetical protein
MKKKALDKKKKGPKGKKARAKAKLERQWGEETVDKSEKRRGRSRLLSSSKKKSDDRQVTKLEPENLSAPKYEFNNDVSDDDSSDEIESDTEAAPLTNLLQSIRQKKSAPKKKTRVVQDQDSDDMDETQDAEAKDDDVMEEEEDSLVDLESESDLEIEENENEKDDDDFAEHAFENKSDLFRQRFSREPLLAEASTSSNEPLIKLTLDASIELHVAAAESDLESRLLKMKADKDGTEKEALQSISRESFECNRQVLQRQWKRKKKGLSTSQSQLYPFLSRYMDLLVTTDSTKVRKLMVCHCIFVLPTPLLIYTHLIIFPRSSIETRCTTYTCCIF